METPSLNCDSSELDFYVSCLCSNPMPDRFTEMKLLKKLIDEGKVPLLRAVVKRVATISCIEKRTVVFKKLVEKFGVERSDESASQIGNHVASHQCLVVDRNCHESRYPNFEEPTVSAIQMTNDNSSMEPCVLSVDENQELPPGRMPVVASSTNTFDAVSSINSTDIASIESVEEVSDKVEVDATNSFALSNSLEPDVIIKVELTADPLELLDCPNSMISSSSRQLKSKVALPSRTKSSQEFSIKSEKKFVEKWIVNPFFNQNENRYKCEHCDKRFDNSESLASHKRKVHRIVKENLKVFDLSRRLRGSKFKCKQCGRKYINMKSLEVHISRTHNVRSTIPCPENCGKMLTKKSALKKHLLGHRPESEWPIGCPLCNKRFQARCDLNRHLLCKIHSHDNLPEVGSDQWWELVYWDKPQDTPKNSDICIINVSS